MARLVLLALATGLAVPSVAASSTVSVSDDAVNFVANPGESNNVQVDFNGGIKIKDAPNGPTPGAGCIPDSNGFVFCGNSATRVNVSTNDMTDSVEVFHTFSGLTRPLNVQLGAGGDRWIASTGHGSASVSDVVDGGSGFDQLDTVGPAADTLSGGPDTDLVVVGQGGPGMTLIIGQGGIGSDVENLGGGNGNDRLVGDSGPNSISGNSGNDEIEGMGGSDVLAGDGGGLTPGDDTIKAADGEADTVTCDAGNDTAEVDDIDDIPFADCENVPPPGPGAVITSGPSGIQSSRAARFEFTTTNTNPGVFQCRIDNQPDFTTCSSPVQLSNLSDGVHTFRVRYDPNAGPPSAATERSWTVDGTGPSVSFTSAPSGEVQGSSATFSFSSSEAGATFRCRLDSGPDTECSSPHTVSGLSDGPHTFSVVAIDGIGNVSEPANASWTTVPLEGSQDVGCTAGGASAGFGAIRLVARKPDACFFDDTVDGSPVRVSLGQVSMNGITLTPEPGTRIIVAPALGDGTVMANGPVKIVFGPPPKPGETPFTVTEPNLRLDRLGLQASLASKTLGIADEALKLAGMKLRPGIDLEFSPDNGGQTKVTFKLLLPSAAFRSVPGSPEAVGVNFSPTLSNDAGITFSGRIRLSEIYMLGQKVKTLDLGYDHATGVFDGTVAVKLGEGSDAFVLTAALQLGIPEIAANLNCGIRKLSLAASELNRPIAAGVNLQRFGGAFECVPDGGDFAAKLTANGGVSLGPKINLNVFEAEAVSVDGTGSLTFPVTRIAPYTLEFSGAGKVVDIPVAQQTVTFTTPFNVRLTGGLDFTGGGFGAQLTYGEQGTWITRSAFNIEAAGTANLLGAQFGANAVFSSTGFAVCVGEPGERTGFGKRWGEELTAFTTCDVGPFRALAPAQASDSFVVGAGRPLSVVAAEGDGAPPKLILTGPGGQRVETPAGPEALSRDGVLVVQDPEHSTTFAILFDPAAGRWSVSTAEGSPSLRRLRVARRLPPLKVTARVAGRGSRRVLTWNAKGLAGQRLQLVERSGGGAKVLTTTTRSSGRLRFTPDPQLGPRRTIEAIAFNGATPRSSTTVARYRVAPPPKPKRVTGLKLAKRVLTWRAQRGVRYELALTLPNGTTRTLTARRARLKLPAVVPKRGTLTASIVALNAAGKPGAVARAKLRIH